MLIFSRRSRKYSRDTVGRDVYKRQVFLNGAYWGLYGLQERVDLKQLDGDKRADLLYKVVANDRPTAEELLSCASTGRYRAFEPVAYTHLPARRW